MVAFAATEKRKTSAKVECVDSRHVIAFAIGSVASINCIRFNSKRMDEGKLFVNRPFSYHFQIQYIRYGGV